MNRNPSPGNSSDEDSSSNEEEENFSVNWQRYMTNDIETKLNRNMNFRMLKQKFETHLRKPGNYVAEDKIERAFIPTCICYFMEFHRSHIHMTNYNALITRRMRNPDFDYMDYLFYNIYEEILDNIEIKEEAAPRSKWQHYG
jgi:hypothetical protein